MIDAHVVGVAAEVDDALAAGEGLGAEAVMKSPVTSIAVLDWLEELLGLRRWRRFDLTRVKRRYGGGLIEREAMLPVVLRAVVGRRRYQAGSAVRRVVAATG
ncbi:MAG: hypothetical protein U0R19_11135 [Bryobacteraceae bacterium]